MKSVFLNIKTSFFKWIHVWPLHILFSVFFSASLFASLKTEPEHKVAALLGILALSWVWCLMCAYTVSPNYTGYKNLLRKLPIILLKGLIFPIGLALIWGNPLAIDLLNSLQTKMLSGQNTAILALTVSGSYLLLLFVFSLIVSPALPKSVVPSSLEKNVFSLMGKDLSRLWSHIKISWDASLQGLFIIFIILMPLTYLASVVEYLIRLIKDTPLSFMGMIMTSFFLMFLSFLPTALAGIVSHHRQKKETSLEQNL
jgi:hypothetical protein